METIADGAVGLYADFDNRFLACDGWRVRGEDWRTAAGLSSMHRGTKRAPKPNPNPSEA